MLEPMTVARCSWQILSETEYNEGKHTYDPRMLPMFETALINASATARLAGGLGKILLCHPRKIEELVYSTVIRKLY